MDRNRRKKSALVWRTGHDIYWPKECELFGDKNCNATNQTYIPGIRILPLECRSASCHFHMRNLHWLSNFMSGTSILFQIFSYFDLQRNIVSLSPKEKHNYGRSTITAHHRRYVSLNTPQKLKKVSCVSVKWNVDKWPTGSEYSSCCLTNLL